MNAAAAELKARVAGLDDEMLVSCIKSLGGSDVDQDSNLVRAGLLGEYEDRNGGDALDALLDRLGM